MGPRVKAATPTPSPSGSTDRGAPRIGVLGLYTTTGWVYYSTTPLHVGARPRGAVHKPELLGKCNVIL